MAFPRCGLIRDRADGSILMTWDFFVPEEMGDVMIEGLFPMPDFDGAQHELIDLTEYSYEQYEQIKERHHEAKVTRNGARGLRFTRWDQGHEKAHEVGPPARSQRAEEEA